MADAVNSTSVSTAAFPQVFPRFVSAEPIPGLAERPYKPLTASDRLAIERDFNGVLERLNALLAISGPTATRFPATGGAHV